MRDVRGFREAVREHRRTVGRTQQQLAKSVGLHPNVLSHKLHGHDNAVLTAPEVVGIATALAGWGALVTRADLYELLELMEVPRHVITAAAWSAPPLDGLRADRDGASGQQATVAPRAPPRAAGTAGEPAARVRPAARDQPAGRPRVTPAPLPVAVTTLIGRERERTEVAAAIAASRLVTLIGAGGTGKTRLALQVARDLAGGFADGVAFVDLAPVADPALLATAIAHALGLAPGSAEEAEGHLAEALRDREFLLVLDNLEQLVEETQLLARLLAAAPGLRLLATSRITLHLYGEHILRVPPLALPGSAGAGAADSEAVRLFLVRARAVRPDFAPDLAPDGGELAAVTEICAVLDGLPLAIELAAARVRLCSCRALLPLLQSRLALLTGGPRDVPPRQRALRATLDWSHALLPPDQRRLFARLGVFAGPFDAAAAAAVTGDRDPVTVLEHLAELADHSLLEITAGDTPGFRMLQTVREYALARLAETEEADTVRRRHLAHYRAVALTARQSLNGPRQAGLLDQLEAAYPNMRAALEFAADQAGHDDACLRDGLRLAAALGLLWQRRGSLAEGMLHLDRLLARDAQRRPGDPAVRVSAVLAACTLACFKGDYARATELARQIIGLCGPLGDHHGLAVAHRMLGEAALAVGDLAAAGPHFQQELDEASLATDVAGQADAYNWQADAYNMLAEIARHRGQFRHAQSLLWRAVKLFRQASDPLGVAVMLSSLGEVARDAGRPVQARRLFDAALRRHAALGDKRHMAYALEGIAAAAGLEGDGHQALVCLGAAQALRDEIGAPLPPVEQAIVDRILAPALATLSARQRRDALRQGRDQPRPIVIAHALTPPPDHARPRPGTLQAVR